MVKNKKVQKQKKSHMETFSPFTNIAEGKKQTKAGCQPSNTTINCESKKKSHSPVAWRRMDELENITVGTGKWMRKK